MDKEEIIRRLKKISGHAVHVVGEPPFIMSLDDGIALDEAVRLLKERESVKPIDETCWNRTYGRCGHCRAPLPALEGLHSKFCWMCGKAVKWE